jgi:hypothetical protein
VNFIFECFILKAFRFIEPSSLWKYALIKYTQYLVDRAGFIEALNSSVQPARITSRHTNPGYSSELVNDKGYCHFNDSLGLDLNAERNDIFIVIF